VLLATVLIGVEIVLRGYLTRPFWYDEIWRARFVSEPPSLFWTSLGTANTPSAAGWMALTRAIGAVVGWHAWALRLPEFAALPTLAAGTYSLTRRFAGRAAASFAGLSIGLCSVVIDLGTQLKPYGVEAATTVAILALWAPRPAAVSLPASAAHATPAVPATPVAARRADRRGWRDRWDSWRRARLARWSAAGAVGLLSVPAVFVILPLAVATTIAARERWRGAAARALPALLLTAAHTALFIGHQSGQRNATYWDRNFLADRSLTDSLSFVGYQLLRLVAAAPAGVDQYDPNVAHAVTDGTTLSYFVLAPAAAVAALVGAVALTWSRPVRERGGALIVTTVLAAEVLMLVASALRYWPFGPTRTNLFLVPPLVILVVVGAERIVLAAAGRITPHRPGTAAPHTPPAAPSGAGRGAARVAFRCVAVLAALGVMAAGALDAVGAVSGDRGLYRRRDTPRGFSLLVDAATTTRRVARPGDLLIVGGRLAESGWIYAMEVSDDAPRTRPVALPGMTPPALGRARPRIGREDTTFLPAYADGTATRAIRQRDPRRLLVFIDAFEAGGGREAGELRADGWCASGGWSFARTGTLTVYQRCLRRPPGLAQ
jgi:hypothetical protein